MSATECFPTNVLGVEEVRLWQKHGWDFSDRGIRVGNGWMVWARHSSGQWKSFLLAAPGDSPLSNPPPFANSEQLELL
jgi:hypothetical protein